MKYALLIFTSLLAALGWLIPEQPPLWATSIAVTLVALALVAEIKLERDDRREGRELRGQIAAIHSRSAAAPKFELSLNKKIVSSELQTIQLDLDGAHYPLEFALRNTGDATATNLQVHLLAPAGLPAPYLGQHWRAMGTPDVVTDAGFAPLDGVTQYTFISPAELNPGDWLRLGHGRISALPTEPAPMKLKVSAEGGAKSSWVFLVKTVV